jgi:hypothetical protein
VLEADDGPPSSGDWLAIATFFTGRVELPARAGEILPFHDPRVQAVPELFVPATRRKRLSTRRWTTNASRRRPGLVGGA